MPSLVPPKKPDLSLDEEDPPHHNARALVYGSVVSKRAPFAGKQDPKSRNRFQLRGKAHGFEEGSLNGQGQVCDRPLAPRSPGSVGNTLSHNADASRIPVTVQLQIL
jgi:hypothetical protein